MVQQFSFQRVAQFIKRDLVLLRGTFTTGFLVAAVVLFLLCLFNMMWDKQLAQSEFFGIFGIVYIPMGLVFTFSLFKEFNNTKANHLYLAIPISTSERLVSKWLTATVIYTMVFSVLAILVGTLAMLAGIVLFGADFNLLSLASNPYGKVVQTYFLVQPVFMVGAIMFSKNRMGKTILSLGLLILGLVLLNLMLYALLNYNFGAFSEEGLGSMAFDKAGADFSIIGKWFYGFILGPLMLVVAYFKMKEKEV